MTTEDPTPNRPKGITRLEILVTIVLVLMCMGLVGFWPGWAFLLLLIGWIKYPLEVADRLTIEWVSVTTACIALALFCVGVHKIGSWLAVAKSTASQPQSWNFRNSVQIVLLILFAFLAGTSMIGIVHQVTWLATKNQPLLDYPTHRDRFSGKNNLKQFGLAIHNYHETYKSFPTSTFTVDGQANHSWQTYLLPFVDMAPLYQQIDLDVPWSDPRNRAPFSNFIPTYQNPGIESFGTDDGGRPAMSHYAGNIRLLRPNQFSSFDSIADGTSQTLLGGEILAKFKPWGDPTNLRDPADGLNQSSSGFGGPYKGGANMLFADGSVRFLSEYIDPVILKALATPSGGEEISDDAY